MTKPPMKNTNTKVPIITNIEDRTQWPELLGLPGNQAKVILEDLYGNEYDVGLVDYGNFVTADFQMDQIFLFLDLDGTVMRTTKVGH